MINSNIIATSVAPIGSPFYLNARCLYAPLMLAEHLKDPSQTLTREVFSGSMKQSLDDFCKELIEVGGLLACSDKSSKTILWKTAFVDAIFGDGTVSVELMAVGNEILDIIRPIIEKFVSKDSKDLVYSLVEGDRGMELRAVGRGSAELIPSNYTEETINDIEYVATEFAKTNSNGRICILSGDPGTGKTYLIRYILSKIDSIFIIVPSNLVSSLDSPRFLPLLLSAKELHKKPITLIIEDGDLCLVPRKSDNMSVIASLLNLTDGILGTMLDIKMIISTNAETKDIDQAILRPGRMTRQILVDVLDYKKANAVYHRLLGKDDISLEKRDCYSLAEIYAIVANKEFKAITINKPKRQAIGFATSHNQESQNQILNKL